MTLGSPRMLLNMQ